VNNAALLKRKRFENKKNVAESRAKEDTKPGIMMSKTEEKIQISTNKLTGWMSIDEYVGK